jgi:hypothetical protein
MSPLEYQVDPDSMVALYRAQLPRAAQLELDAILDDARRRNVEVDKVAIAGEIYSAHLVRVADLPPELADVGAPEASGGRWYELNLDGANPCDLAAMTALREQFFAECRHVKTMTRSGLMTVAEAWEQVRHPVPPRSAQSGANGHATPVARTVRTRSRKRKDADA